MQVTRQNAKSLGYFLADGKATADGLGYRPAREGGRYEDYVVPAHHAVTVEVGCPGYHATVAWKPCPVRAAAAARLVKLGLLNPNTGSKLVRGVDGEDALLAKWRSALAGFIRKGVKVEVGMRVERLHFDESRCYLNLDLVR